MKITLAWPREGYGDAGDTVEMPDVEARQVIADGHGRIPDAVGNLSEAELDVAAAAEGVDLTGAKSVTDKRAAVKAARTGKEA